MQRVTGAAHQSITTSNRLRIGTRGSALALWQAGFVRDLLQHQGAVHRFELEIISSEGDIDKESSLLTIGGRGVFASALQEALVDQSVDFAVHSTKDLPTLTPPGLAIAAFPAREDAHDVVVSRHGVGLAELPSNPVIGTSSRRRAVQVRALRPDAQIVELRGNIDTRLRKAESPDYDAVILAAAGLIRMGWQDRITEHLHFDVFVPSPGQGALAIETRVDPDPAFALAEALDVPDVATAVRLERAFLVAMAGGCTTPIGAHAEVEGDLVRFWAMVGSDDGERLVHTFETLETARAAEDIPELARRLVRDIAPSWSGTPHPETALAEQPLAGRTVLVTGSPEFTGSLSPAFVAEGAPVLEAVTLEPTQITDPKPLERARKDLTNRRYHWLVVTSQRSIPALAGIDLHASGAQIAVVGERTANALRELGLEPDLIPEVQTGEGLATALIERGVSGARVLCLLGNQASDTVPAALTAAGASVVRVESYAVAPVESIPDVVRHAIRAGTVEMTVFPSPSSVDVLCEQLGTDLAALSGACLVAIGPTTADAMTAHDLPVHVTAASPSAEGVVAACRNYFAIRFGTPASTP